MPSLYRRKDSKFWWAAINTGKSRKMVSTKQTDKGVAMAFASQLEQELRMQRPGLHSRLIKLADEFSPATLQSPSQYLNNWVARKEHEVSPATHQRYKACIKNILPHLNPNLQVIDKPAVTDLRDKLVTEFSPTTVNLTLKILRMALGDAVQDGLLPSNPCKGVKALKSPPSTRRPFTATELATLLDHAPAHWRGLIHLALTTGQRLNDLAELRWDQLDLSRGILTARAAKTQKLIECPVPALTMRVLQALPTPVSQDLPVFPEIAKLTKPARSNAFRILLNEAGLTNTHPRDLTARYNKQRKGQPLTFHSLRHTANTLLKSTGASQAIAQAVMGHDSAAVNEMYTHLNPDDLRPHINAVAKQLETILST